MPAPRHLLDASSAVPLDPQLEAPLDPPSSSSIDFSSFPPPTDDDRLPDLVVPAATVSQSAPTQYAPVLEAPQPSGTGPNQYIEELAHATAPEADDLEYA